ncbi:glutamine--fructose-6-phosphate transaminase (isomerizing) [Leucothrix arctica]|uniref:Glutamine--fructose-6-phosphate aminotransferase [isomerizing] n=1 Tax=Leucothrix arctica TaxID=1481894 RepID=A0A317C8E9_9GAMM|nr:glutamine--fructose-6-phosphate transaminase (isomerizing) [Leucothrix arctica]PWQ94531.1 glutamine--fructose-6-phosphate transaminase (isomerizing) [Leucothrix arctica]
MCGIVGAMAQRDVIGILVEGLRRLEYRGYDSAGVAVINHDRIVERTRALGKVAELETKLAEAPIFGSAGIAHTRWATHGEPAERNAHPHISNDRIAVVHNGIIENYEPLREELIALGYNFESETDTEVVVHLIDTLLKPGVSLLEAVNQATKKLRGAYALGVIANDDPEHLIAVRQGSPLVLGLGIGEYFIGSDIQALLPVTNRFIYLENGDSVDMTLAGFTIFDESGLVVERPIKESLASSMDSDLGEYRHFMLKEIYEQPAAIQNTLAGRVELSDLRSCISGDKELLEKVFNEIREVQIIACGTSYHSGLTARYWIESLTDLPCNVEVASEYRYRRQPKRDGVLFITISQSGETADSLAALEKVKQEGCLATLTICNVPESSLTRESDFSLMTVAGPEIGVASTKAFTTQLVALQLLTICLMQRDPKNEAKSLEMLTNLKRLPAIVEQVLQQDDMIKKMGEAFIDKHHALFLGRGDLYPIAMEGALKLKEISYIHAEAYPAGELKHGPLALVDSEMPIVAVAPNTNLLEKLKSNLEEVRSRGGVLYLFADEKAEITEQSNIHIIRVPEIPESLIPIVYTIPLQLLSYHVAVFKGTDVDKPRNLAKSVTVE